MNLSQICNGAQIKVQINVAMLYETAFHRTQGCYKIYATWSLINIGYIVYLGLLAIVSSIFSFVFILMVIFTCVAKPNKINILKNNDHFILDISLAITPETLDSSFSSCIPTRRLQSYV